MQALLISRVGAHRSSQSVLLRRRTWQGVSLLHSPPRYSPGVAAHLHCQTLQFHSLPSFKQQVGTSPPSTTTVPPIPPAPAQQKPLKVEGPVEQVLRELKEAKEKEAQAAAADQSTTSTSVTPIPDAKPVVAEAPTTAVNPAPAAASSAVAASAPAEPKKSFLEKAKHEFQHYWSGFKLLGAEISISARLLYKLLRGNTLTRREHRQLRRTTGDLIRLVPLLIILLVPFLEFALPFLLYLFPNMLPSTFESKFQKEEKRKKLLKVRLEMAKFLQETVEEVSVSGAGMSAAKEFSDFFHTYRNSGEQAPTEDILNIARKFKDELTLQNLSRPQLVSMARYMSISVFGTDTFLRHQIERQLHQLKQDDLMIAHEGVDSLTIQELQQACMYRGIRTSGVSPARLRSELSQWLELHLKHSIPSTILILSRAFALTEKIPSSTEEAVQRSAEALQATLAALPDQVLNEAALRVSEEEGSATFKQKLNVLQEQEELIADELEQEALEAAKKKEKELKAKEKELKEKELKEKELKAKDAAAEAPTEAASKVEIAEVPAASEATVPEPIPEPETILTNTELQRLGEALKTLSSDSALGDVKEKLDELKEEHKEFKEDIQELTQVTQKEPSKSATTLSERVNKMIAKLEKELVQYDSEIGSKLNLLRPDDLGTITIEELEEALKIIQAHPDDERIKKIVKALDTDQDGRVNLHEIMILVKKAEFEGHGVVKEEPKKTTAAPPQPAQQVPATPAPTTSEQPTEKKE